jgi:hypothetical protein
MESQDDPEARIRELERGLADVARASELGTGARYVPPAPPPTQYSSAPGYVPPMPAPYEATYLAPRYTAPRRKSSGYRPWGIIVAASVVCFVALSAGIAVYAGKVSPGGSAPGIFGGDSTMTVAPGGQVSVSGVDEVKKIACDEGAVSISGVRNNVTITGHCVKVTISGVSNSVTIESANTISASGLKNSITYHSGEPKIENSGSDNIVRQG